VKGAATGFGPRSRGRRPSREVMGMGGSKDEDLDDGIDVEDDE
jgi:hypothetical protein